MRWYYKFLLMAVVLATGHSSSAGTPQKLRTVPDGAQITIKAAVLGITRITVKGDRVSRLFNDSSNYSFSNDENTGDIYLKYNGPLDDTVVEDAFLITEAGYTINLRLAPVQLRSSTAIITLTLPKEDQNNGLMKGAGPQRADIGDLVNGGQSSSLVGFVRKVILDNLDGKAPPKARHGSVIKTVQTGGLKAKIIVIGNFKVIKSIRPQDFYNDRVLAVWLDKTTLGPKTAAWGIIVEGTQ